MKAICARPFAFVGAFAACFIMAMTTGCASGGYKLTRQYARWVNSQDTILRVILYILTLVVFAVTMLIDMVYNNTMDFWNGTVAAGTYNFKQGDKTYVAQHEVLPGSRLKRSTIRVFGKDNALLQEVVLRETPMREIELYVDGTLRTRVHDLSGIPTASMFDANGKHVEERMIFATATVAVTRSSALAN